MKRKCLNSVFKLNSTNILKTRGLISKKNDWDSIRDNSYSGHERHEDLTTGKY